MKGIKVAEFANATSKRFQSDHILATKIQMPDGIEVLESIKKLVVNNEKLMQDFKKISEDNVKLTETIAALEKAVKELTEKVNSFEVEEA